MVRQLGRQWWLVDRTSRAAQKKPLHRRGVSAQVHRIPYAVPPNTHHRANRPPPPKQLLFTPGSSADGDGVFQLQPSRVSAPAHPTMFRQKHSPENVTIEMPRTPPNLVTNGIVDLDAFLAYLKSHPVTPTTTDEEKQQTMRRYKAQRRRIQKERRKQERQAAPQAGTVAKPAKMVDTVNQERLLEPEPYITRNTADVVQNGQGSRVDISQIPRAGGNTRPSGLRWKTSIVGMLDG